jgi:predicted nuclease with RNAse H fold
MFGIGRGKRASSSPRWAGVDVGAKKGFDAAVIDNSGLAAGPARFTDVDELVGWLVRGQPRVVAVDAPCSPAPDGELSRRDERDLAKSRVCGIRYTPDRAALAANEAYYAWIVNGFSLYRALADAERSARWRTVECFPTATWSRIGGPRGTRTRARWSREVLEGCGLRGTPPRMGQDARDAIGAAITAQLFDEARTESFGDIVVPRWHGTSRSGCPAAGA